MSIEVRKPRPGELESLGATQWPIWTCPVSSFDWSYSDKETCYILEGQVTVEHKGGSTSFGPGDLVIFSKGLDCTWKVTTPVKKHYKFGSF